MLLKSYPRICLSLIILSSAIRVVADGVTLESAGVRSGLSEPSKKARFYQVESFVNWNLPWRWTWGDGWSVQTRFDLTGGWMNGRGEDAVFATVGPSFELGWKNLPLTLDAGTSPTVLGREQFGNTDFGTVFQFTTHVGLNWKPSRRWTVTSRVQHMSNANIGPSNPGLNLLSLGVGWRF